ncbi:MAG: 4-hydroxybenzoate octaprenyltransferase [Alphaproteobacteria bacterium MarineAlpha6_Bin3]|nr:MAG: 4-hydroxybenzoate octaprenyltransferase [Alphaproteobacteria bacterium MarineAlpha6_Bin3]|tara:strand:- start:22049 stop:22912 length:864 start_codon:yes stop_codon:yes gene_type:complete
MFKYILYYLKNFLILIRINKPTGIMLLMFPAIWSILIVLKEEIDIYLIFLFAYGSFIMRSAGCIINDIIDIKFDKNVKRTKSRPLASENLEITDAIILFIIFISIGLSILLTLNSTCILLGLIVFPLILIYPLMKRYTNLPQIFLAIVFNFSVLISWTAAKGEFDYQSLLLYLACFFWTLGYDTIYACQDKEDDKKIGVKSLAIYLEKNINFWISFFYLSFVIVFSLVGILNNINFIFFIFLLSFALKIMYDFFKTRKLKSKNFIKIFQVNSWYGFFITIGLFLNYI